MDLQLESRTYRLTGLTPLLGSQPASLEVRTKYLQSKAGKLLTPEQRAEENERFDYDEDDKGINVFARDSKRGDCLCLMGHHIKGFFKESLLFLQPQAGIAMPQKKVDGLLFVEPRFIPIMRGDEKIYEEDNVLERPLIANTPRGPRTALQASEQIEDPWWIEFELTLLPSTATAKSKALTWDAVELALQYGAYHGIGQWRNAAYGKYKYQRVD